MNSLNSPNQEAANTGSAGWSYFRFSAGVFRSDKHEYSPFPSCKPTEGHYYIHGHHKQRNMFSLVFRWGLRSSHPEVLTFKILLTPVNTRLLVSFSLFHFSVLSGKRGNNFLLFLTSVIIGHLPKLWLAKKADIKITTKNTILLFSRLFEKYYEIVGHVHIYFKSSL